MEKVYQYFWRHRIARNVPLKLTDGRIMTVLSPGVPNNDAGPDFSDARIMVDGVLWAGNVEIHAKGSDWYHHGHDKDPAYDNIILHVVGVHDKVVRRANGESVPTYLLPLARESFITYAALSAPVHDCRCRQLLRHIPPLAVNDWLETLGMARLAAKATALREILVSLKNDWEQALFALLARGLGFGLNAEPFEMLAKSVSLKTLSHHSDSILQTEAILFGQAGMLDASQHPFDEYYQTLCREYYFLARKYGLRPMRHELWKYSRTRPHNFPHRRIALLAAACAGGFRIMDRLLEMHDREPAEIRELFDWRASEYWQGHFAFGHEAQQAPAQLSTASRDLLLINVVAPFLYTYGTLRGITAIEESAIDLLYDINAENNMYVRQWQSAGVSADNAFRSQSLLHLTKNYCMRNRCMECRWGHYLLRRTAGEMPYTEPGAIAREAETSAR